MIASTLAGLAMACATAAEAPDPPLCWSPSGEWVAFAAATPTVDRSLARFPLFPDEGGTGDAGAADPAGPAEAPTYRIWAVRVEDGRAVKVAEGPGPLTSPAWGPDGRGLAFGRVARGGAGAPDRWEVVVAYGADQDVVLSRPLESGALRGGALISEAVAWAPGGGLLAVPDPERVAVELIDPRGGRTLRRLEGARLLAFSPIGARMAFYRDRDGRTELVEGRPDEGPEADRPVDLVERADQAPSWTADGRTLLYMKLGPPAADGPQARFFSHRLDGDGPAEVKQVESPAMPGERILGAYLSVADDGVDQFFVVQYSDRQAALAYHQGAHPIDRLHPLGGLGMLGAPSVSPKGDRVAIRFGGPGPGSLPGLITMNDKRLAPLAPDDELRAAWVAALAAAAEPPANRPRPTRLPIAAELGGAGPSPAVYKRLAELGLRLTDELGRGGAPPALIARPSLAFSYLRGDYDAADRALDALPSDGLSPDRADRLLGLRAQISLARGRDGEAREILEYVRRQHRGRIARVEPDGSGGLAISPEAPEAPSWPDELWALHQDRLDRKAPAERPEPPSERPRGIPSPFDESPTPGAAPPVPPPEPAPAARPFP